MQNPFSIDEFSSSLPYPLDEFQRSACEALEKRKNVLVAAPTGSGKTTIARFAISLALQSSGGQVFYTSPMKALSNQKYTELCEVYGEEHVGLLTGDVNRNGDAQIVVMTTEILRNMLYEGSKRIDDLFCVILDEVHYLGDRNRGPIWEEVIIHLPQRVLVLGLSATVSNIEELGDWMYAIRGNTEVIISEVRPVPLFQHVLTEDGTVPLLRENTGKEDERQQQRGGDSNPRKLLHSDFLRYIAQKNQQMRQVNTVSRSRRGGPRQKRRPAKSVMPREDVVAALFEADFLPAIVFIFSRAGCDQAVKQCVRAGVCLTTEQERQEIRDIVFRSLGTLDRSESRLLGVRRMLEGFEHGVAAHHAGLLPIFKQIIEELFQKKLIKVVFATDTLAIGINMPAKSVVIESLEKFNGIQRVPVTSSEYTQLIGRAGRRGIDPEGHALLLWYPTMNINELAFLAGSRCFEVHSHFVPHPNMAVNLLERRTVGEVCEVLQRSFAQFQTDRSLLETAKEMMRLQEQLQIVEERERHAASAAHTEGSETAEMSAGERAKNGETSETAATANSSAKSRKRFARSLESAKLRKRIARLNERMLTRSTRTVKRFERVCNLLRSLDYLRSVETSELQGEEEHNRMHITVWGTLLQRIHGERGLLSTEIIRKQIWKQLRAPEIAALTSTLVYEPRARHERKAKKRESREKRALHLSQTFWNACADTLQLWSSLEVINREHYLEETEEPEMGAIEAIYLWASGRSLEEVLDISGLEAGEFVRLSRQIIDLLDQMMGACEHAAASIGTQSSAHEKQENLSTVEELVDSFANLDFDAWAQHLCEQAETDSATGEKTAVDDLDTEDAAAYFRTFAQNLRAASRAMLRGIVEVSQL